MLKLIGRIVGIRFAAGLLVSFGGLAAVAPVTDRPLDTQDGNSVEHPPATITRPASSALTLQDDGPMITLDPGMHTGPIRRIAVNGDQTTLVTASDDKSARFWDLASGQLLATLHPPAGPDAIGRLYGAAISSANRVALAGTTAPSGGNHRIFLYDLLSHAFVASFDARGGNVKRLEWSPDGLLLAAAYADTPALRVFDKEGRVVFEETFSGDAYYVTFASTGQMAVSVTDGSVHLYSTAGDRVVRDGTIRTALHDPRGVHFSPDGKLLAVGYFSRQSDVSVRVDVFNVTSRDLAKSFAFADISQGNLMNVVWQSDGRALYAGGTGYRGRNEFVVKRIGWPDGKAVDINVGANSILDFVALRDGKIVFSTADPMWGVIDQDRVISSVSVPAAQFYEASALRISDDASKVSWSYRFSEPPVHFDLADRQVRDGIGDAKILADPSTFGIAVSGWENSFSPRINGKPLQLQPTEVARASAVLPQNGGVILGSSRTLRRFDPDGTPRWVVSLPTEVRAVNVSRDGKILVVGMLDGSIRWRRVADGTPLLSLFATRDRRWIVWTEPGYFDVSAGAENLVGWLVNRGNGDQADYYPLSRFRDKYYRPDVVDRVLASGDSVVALVRANEDRQKRAEAADEPVRKRVEAIITPTPIQALLPPMITLRSPAVIESATTTLTINYAVLTQDQSPITMFDVRIDGRPLQFNNTLPIRYDGEAIGTLTLTLPERSSQLQIFAGNRSGISVPALVSFQWQGPPKPPPVAAVADRRPRLYLLSVGVSRYANPNYNLGFAAKDATDFAQTMRKQDGKFYREVDARVLTDEHATRADVVEGLEWLRSVTTQQDVGMLFLAGHGQNDVDDVYYFLPHDVDIERLARTGVGEERFRDVLIAMKGKAIFFVDTCYSGKAIGVLTNPDLTRIANKFSSPEYGVIVFSASYGRQESIESVAWGHGAFTKALVDGLVGKADYRREGLVTHKGLDYFVSSEVKKLTSGMQTPVTAVPTGIGDFGLAKVLEDKN
jgi:hypothetical protein